MEPTDVQTPLPLDPARVGRAADFSRQSNLALAFLCLPRDKRADMNVFYTFCRVVDDIADSEEFTEAEKQAQLDAWKRALTDPAPDAGEGQLRGQVRALVARYGLPVEHLLEIIAGCEMDLRPKEFGTFEDLRAYCHRVASVVGLVSIEIFGYRPEHAEALRRYATDLGLALQLTNIIRDVARDAANGGRVYLPADDLARFGLSPGDLRAHAGDHPPTAARVHAAWDETAARLTQLLRFEADRAERFYRSAAAALPAGERRAMVAAEIMRAVYHRLLRTMRGDNFRVFSRRYHLGTAAKLWTVATVALASRRGGRGDRAPEEASAVRPKSEKKASPE